MRQILKYETIINTLADKIEQQDGEMLIMRYRIDELKKQVEQAEGAQNGN